MERLVIGLVGNARTGKDTVAKYIINRYSDLFNPFRRIAFADPIKQSAAAMLGISIEELEECKNKDILIRGINIRTLLQDMGKLMREKTMGEYFTRFLYEKIIHSPSNINYVISDVRMPDEHDFMANYLPNWHSIKIVRPSLDTGKDFYQDISEKYVNDINTDYVIVNDGTLDDLYYQVDEIMKKVRS